MCKVLIHYVEMSHGLASFYLFFSFFFFNTNTKWTRFFVMCVSRVRRIVQNSAMKWLQLRIRGRRWWKTQNPEIENVVVRPRRRFSFLSLFSFPCFRWSTLFFSFRGVNRIRCLTYHYSHSYNKCYSLEILQLKKNNPKTSFEISHLWTIKCCH